MTGVVEAIEISKQVLSPGTSLVLTLMVFTAIIVTYSVFIYYFYRFMARKNIISFNLSKYNTYERPGLTKFFAFIFYVLEYIVLLPILSVFWFSFLAILILLISEEITASTTLLIATALVSSVRVTSYISKNLSQDLAKMIPLTLLSIGITKPEFFSISNFVMKFYEIPDLLSILPYYILFIIGIEFSMRITELITKLRNL